MTAAIESSRHERRWVVLGEDGRHVILGRHSEPLPTEITAAETALLAQGLRGWLAIAEGDYWVKGDKLSLLMVRALGTPNIEFGEAVRAFEALRRSALATC